MRALPDDAPDVFVTMNPERAIDPASILVERRFEHPIATPDRDDVVARLDALQGCGRAWLCGSHLRAPFLHEQAIEDGQRVADRLADSSHHGRVSFTAPATPPSPRSPSAVASPSAPVGAIGAAVEAPALAIGHHHAPGEPCTPLARAEVERALADLRR
jgi:hypothetical protein